ncbi:MAG: hypothetical protein ACTIJ9_10550 [Aequorivita sp.]
MNLIERYKKPTPKFFKTLRNIGIVLGTVGATILASPVTIPVGLVTVATYLTLAGAVVTAVSQAVVSDDGKEVSKSEIKQEGDDAI